MHDPNFKSSNSNFKFTGCSWSGGKDSCFALMRAIEHNYKPAVLINMMNENGKISRSHGLPKCILEQQASAMQLPIITTSASWENYELLFVNTLQQAKKKYQIEAMIFGDIDLQQHRDWEEKVCEKANLKAVLPLWQGYRKQLVLQMLEAGIETIIVSCNKILGEEFLGKIITPELVNTLEEKGVDVCGENGEFHTLVVNCPLFSHAIKIPAYTKVLHDNYWFVQWE